jgi:hypothetical protein
MREVQVTVGATEGLFATVQALVDPGDEVVVVEPCYDAYPAMVAHGGRRPGRRADGGRGDGRWRLDPRRSPPPSRRAPVICSTTRTTRPAPSRRGRPSTPWSPPPSAPTRGVVVDEVYEHLAFVPFTPGRLAPAWERTLTVGSVGKTFGVTGWKVGWVTGPAPLVAAVRAAAPVGELRVATPLQHAVASSWQGVGAAGGRRAAATTSARATARAATRCTRACRGRLAPTAPTPATSCSPTPARWGSTTTSRCATRCRRGGRGRDPQQRLPRRARRTRRRPGCASPSAAATPPSPRPRAACAPGAAADSDHPAARPSRPPAPSRPPPRTMDDTPEDPMPDARPQPPQRHRHPGRPPRPEPRHAARRRLRRRRLRQADRGRRQRPQHDHALQRGLGDAHRRGRGGLRAPAACPRPSAPSRSATASRWAPRG